MSDEFCGANSVPGALPSWLHPSLIVPQALSLDTMRRLYPLDDIPPLYRPQLPLARPECRRDSVLSVARQDMLRLPFDDSPLDHTIHDSSLPGFHSADDAVHPESAHLTGGVGSQWCVDRARFQQGIGQMVGISHYIDNGLCRQGSWT